MLHYLDCEPRIDQHFKQKIFSERQLHESALIHSSVNCIKYFCFGYMHLVCLGVVRRLLLYLKEGPHCRILSNQLNEVSDCLVSFYGKMFSEFAPQLCALSDLKRWKAAEFRHFLTYTGVIALKGTVSYF